jgi:hypothetical protein
VIAGITYPIPPSLAICTMACMVVGRVISISHTDPIKLVRHHRVWLVKADVSHPASWQVNAKDFEADLVQFLEGIGEDRLAKNVRGKHVGW